MQDTTKDVEYSPEFPEFDDFENSSPSSIPLDQLNIETINIDDDQQPPIGYPVESVDNVPEMEEPANGYAHEPIDDIPAMEEPMNGYAHEPIDDTPAMEEPMNGYVEEPSVTENYQEDVPSSEGLVAYFPTETESRPTKKSSQSKGTKHRTFRWNSKHQPKTRKNINIQMKSLKSPNTSKSNSPSDFIKFKTFVEISHKTPPLGHPLHGIYKNLISAYLKGHYVDEIESLYREYPNAFKKGNLT